MQKVAVILAKLILLQLFNLPIYHKFKLNSLFEVKPNEYPFNAISLFLKVVIFSFMTEIY